MNYNMRSLINLLEGADTEHELRWLINEQPKAMKKVIDYFLYIGIAEIIFGLDGYGAEHQVEASTPDEFGLDLSIYDHIEDMGQIASIFTKTLHNMGEDFGSEVNPKLNVISKFVHEIRPIVEEKAGGYEYYDAMEASNAEDIYDMVQKLIKKNIVALRNNFIENV